MFNPNARKLFGSVPFLTLMVPALAFPATPVVMAPFQSDKLKIEMAVPADWQIRAEEQAVGFASPNPDPLERAAVGILKSAKTDVKLEQAAHEEYDAENQPYEWHQMPTTLAGRRAIRVTVPVKDKPHMKRVDFYVEGPDGVYIVQVMAPRSQWYAYDDAVFSPMIRSLRFLP